MKIRKGRINNEKKKINRDISSVVFTYVFPIDHILQVLLAPPCHALDESKAWDMLLLLATSGP